MTVENIKKMEEHLREPSVHCKHPPRQQFVFLHQHIRGTTPLLLASQQGNIEAVKYLVETWEIDVNTTATYYLEPFNQAALKDKYHRGTSPLHAAAFHGRNNIVCYLLEKGASVSAKTSDGITPLYATMCYVAGSRKELPDLQKERYAVVRSLLQHGALAADSFRAYIPYFRTKEEAIWASKLCGVEALKALINAGLDLNKSVSGGTLLFYMADLLPNHQFTSADSLTIVEMMIEKGADVSVRDFRSLTPILRAAEDVAEDGRLSLHVMDLLLEKGSYSRIEKIDALELAGASILFRAIQRDDPLVTRAFAYWNRAIELRLLEPSIFVDKIFNRKTGGNVEWTTEEDLKQLKVQPNRFKFQSLLTKLRIWLTLPDKSYFYSKASGFLNSLELIPDLTVDAQIELCLAMMWGKCEISISRCHDSTTDRNSNWIKASDDVVQLVSQLLWIQQEYPTLINFEKLNTSLDLIIRATNLTSPTVVDTSKKFKLFEIMEMIFSLPDISSGHKRTAFIESLQKMGPGRLDNSLLTACIGLKDYPSLVRVRILLGGGADPNAAVDLLNKNTCLHIAAAIRDRNLSDAAGLFLVEFGAKPHTVNSHGKTALNTWIEIHETEANRNEVTGGWSARPEWFRPVPDLVRLAARVLRKERIPYVDIVPAETYPHIEL